MKRKLIRIIALLGVLALVAAACSNEESDDTTTTAAETTTTAAEETTTTAAAAPETTTAAPETTTSGPGGEVATDVGVTDEPCPGGNPDRGCIYLGVLTDESAVFAAAAPALVGAQRAFWAGVNATGGIGGAYDVALPDEYKKDTQYNPELFVTSYNEIAGDVAAVAQSLGTSQSLAALDDYERDSTVAAPMTWWSGWAFEEEDKGLVIEFGTNYCFEAMNAMDWAVAALPNAGRPAPTSIGILRLDNDYGLDYAAGARIGAEANGIEVAWEAPIVAVAAGGDPQQVEAIGQVLANPVDIVFLVMGPTETAAIVAGTASQTPTPPVFIGAAPTWNVGLLASPAAPAFEAGIYFQSSFTGPWDYDSPGHERMRQTLAAAGVTEPNDFFISGWISQYGLKAALDAAYANGDLTRAGIANAARTLTSVDYEGMVDTRSFVGDPNEIFPRRSLVGGVDTSQSTGIIVVQDFFTGSTAESFVFDAPCAG